MSDPTYDGLCGIPSFFTVDGRHFRCKLEMGHGGDHDWKKHEHHFHIVGGVTRNDMIRHFHPVPVGCTCQPIRQRCEDDIREDGKIVDWVFDATCTVHNRPRTSWARINTE